MQVVAAGTVVKIISEGTIFIMSVQSAKLPLSYIPPTNLALGVNVTRLDNEIQITFFNPFTLLKNITADILYGSRPQRP